MYIFLCVYIGISFSRVWRTNYCFWSNLNIWQQPFSFCPCPTAPRRKLIAVGVHNSHGSGRPLSLSHFPFLPPLSLSLFSHSPCFYLIHKSRKFLVRAPFRPSECGHARADKSPKNGDFRERGKYVANGAIGNSNSVASDENILWADERCVVCLTSGPAGSFVRVGVEKRSRTHTAKHTCASVCVFRGWWKGTGWLEGLYRFVDETTVIRHCVWPHPRLCQDLWVPPLPPALACSSPRSSVALLPIPIGSLACNYRISRYCNVGATLDSVDWRD